MANHTGPTAPTEAPPADHITDKARAVGEGVLRALAERFRLELGRES